MQLIQTKQSEAKGLEIVGLITLQWHPGRDLQSLLCEFVAGLYVRIIGITNDNTRRFKSRSCDALDTPFGQQRAKTITEFLLFRTNSLESIGFRLFHNVTKSSQ